MALSKHDIYSMDVFLRNSIYHIPTYQREYSWEDDELDDFWRDLEVTVDEPEDIDHFFGQVVVHNDQDKIKYIIDGQQRTTTSLIFLRTIQLMFHKVYQDSGNTIPDATFNEITISKSYLGDTTKPHLVLGELADQQFFLDNIISSKAEPNLLIKKTSIKKKSQQNLHNAYVFFYKKLNDLIAPIVPIEEKHEILEKYYDTFINRFRVLYVEATRMEEAFVIFETLNARGKELEASDLLKTYIFSRSKPDEINKAQVRWTNMISTLDGADPTKYIRCYWNSSSQKLVREKELYRRVVADITNPVQSRDFLEDIEKYSQVYHDMVNPSDNVSFSDPAIVTCLKNLSILKASTFYSLVMAMLRRTNPFDEKTVLHVLEKIETLYFRNNTICRNTANELEVFFSGLAYKVYSEQLDSEDEIVSAIEAKMVPDNVFREAFEVWQSKTKETIRYILYKIHLEIADNTTQVTTNNSVVHIEHIMPCKYEKWNVTEAMHEEYLWRLGNLALMNGKLNTKVSNDTFENKKSIYKDSPILPNPDVYNYEVWDEKAIEDRQRRLAAYAMNIWKIK